MNRKCFLIATLWLLMVISTSAWAQDLNDLLDRVVAFNIKRSGYVLGKALSKDQREYARRHSVDIDQPQLFKFKDGHLFVVADKTTSKVVIMYEENDRVERKTIQDLVGNLFLEFGKPTVFSHDKVIYWAWDQNGLITTERFKAAKKKKRPLAVLATVKLNSSLEIMQAENEKATGNVYYIISSDPVLKLIKTTQ